MASFLSFPGNQAMQARALALNNCSLVPARQYLPEAMIEYGLAEQMETKLIKTYPDGFYDDEVLRVFRNDQPGYKELVVEFLASFNFDISEQDGSFNKKKRITFRLLNKKYKMNLVDFGIALGLQEKSVDKDLYLEHLDFADVLEPPNFTVGQAWSEFGMVDYDPSNARESHLRNPLLRVLHRYLAWTIHYNAQHEKINEQQLKGLYFCMHREYRWNIPHVMALMFRGAQTSENRPIPGGQFITTLATNLGILNPSLLRRMAPPTTREIKGRSVMHQSMLIQKATDGGYRLYRDRETKTGMENAIEAGTSAGGSSSRQTRPRPSRVRQGGQVPINLGHVARQNDELGYYNDEIQHMIFQSDQRAHARFLHTLQGDLPPAFLDEFAQLRMWNERMGYPNQPNQGEEEEDE